MSIDNEAWKDRKMYGHHEAQSEAVAMEDDNNDDDNDDDDEEMRKSLNRNITLGTHCFC